MKYIPKFIKEWLFPKKVGDLVYYNYYNCYDSKYKGIILYQSKKRILTTIGNGLNLFQPEEFYNFYSPNLTKINE